MTHPLDPVFKPQSIAVVGASRTRSSLGRQILHNLIQHEFSGKVFPVNPSAEVIHSIKCFKRVSDIPDVVDLAIISVPKRDVLDSIDDCGAKGVKGLIVITAGYRETNESGAALERELLNKVRRYGMRMIGPNCMGVINTHPDFSMNASFAPSPALRGNVGFASQSGALGVALLNIASRIGLGFSVFVSMGNKTDTSGNDFLEYMETDPETKVILLYLESFGNPRRFTQICRRITKTKPVIAVKSGRTAEGARAASSHTGALAGMDIAIDALFNQCGVHRATSVEELFDMALAFSRCGLPRGNRIGIITNAGGPGIMATDACVSLGMELPSFSAATNSELRKILPEEASVQNPVDLIASANRESYSRVLDLVLRDPHIDAALVIVVPPPNLLDPAEIAEVVSEVGRRFDKPVLGVFMDGKETLAGKDPGTPLTIPCYLFPESAAKALSALNRQREWQERPKGELREYPVNRDVVELILAGVRAEGRLELTGPEALAVLDAYGIRISRFGYARNLEEAIATAHGIGYPVVMKLMSKQVVHKTEVGGVLVDIRNVDELTSGFMTLLGRAERHKVGMDGILIQEMVKGEQELVFGMAADKQFGPLLMFGMGGIYVETLKDVTFKLWPITDLDAREMIASIRGYSILKGVRGEPGVDLSLLEETLLRISQLVGDFEELAELDINPLIISGHQQFGKVVDARVRLKD